MNYYPFHIGDYVRSTHHLSPTENLTYRLLIDRYFDTEQPIENDPALLARKLKMPTKVVAGILSEFFTLTDAGWFNDRCDAEIQKYYLKKAKNSDAGKASAAARALAKQQKPTGVEQPSTDVETGSTKINQPEPEPEPEPIQKKKTGSKLPCVDWLKTLVDDYQVPEQVAKDWLAVRKAKGKPLTTTAMALMVTEATKAGITVAQAITVCAGEGWQGFKAEWLAKAKPSTLGFIADHNDRSWADPQPSFIEKHTNPDWREGLEVDGVVDVFNIPAKPAGNTIDLSWRDGCDVLDGDDNA
jgi:uncharacterized protein YdaU (DUF1376 family)